jgi:hypothetical protein
MRRKLQRSLHLSATSLPVPAGTSLICQGPHRPQCLHGKRTPLACSRQSTSDSLPHGTIASFSGIEIPVGQPLNTSECSSANLPLGAHASFSETERPQGPPPSGSVYTSVSGSARSTQKSLDGCDLEHLGARSVLCESSGHAMPSMHMDQYCRVQSTVVPRRNYSESLCRSRSGGGGAAGRCGPSWPEHKALESLLPPEQQQDSSLEHDEMQEASSVNTRTGAAPRGHPGSLRRRPRRQTLPQLQAELLRLEPLTTEAAPGDGRVLGCSSAAVAAGAAMSCPEARTASSSDSGMAECLRGEAEPAVLVRRRASLLRVRAAAAAGGPRARMTVRLPHVVAMRSRGSFAQGRIATVRGPAAALEGFEEREGMLDLERALNDGITTSVASISLEQKAHDASRSNYAARADS